jgi:hypothetical protein
MILRRSFFIPAFEPSETQISGGVSGEILINSKLSGVPEAHLCGSVWIRGWKYEEILKS